MGAVFNLIVLLSIIFFIPLVPIVFCGQEHTIHSFLTILFVYICAKNLSNEKIVFKEYLLSLI
jgi:hypothetical protein